MPDGLARFLLCLIEGMRVLGKTAPGIREMDEMVAIAMTALD